jgi:cytochrome c6
MIKQTFIFSLILISCTDTSTDRSSAAAGAASKPNGQSVFRERCVVCHGADGKLGLNGAKDLTQSALSMEERIEIITNGKKLMTPFGTVLSAEEIKAVAEYTLTLKQ